MLRRYLIIPIVILLALLPLWHTAAQGQWTAWVYQPVSGQLLRIDQNGAVISTQRIVVPDGYSLPETVIFSHDGEQVAYISEDPNQYIQQLHILNLQTGTQIAPISIPVADTALYRDDYFVLTKAAFSVDGMYLIYVKMVGGVGWSIDVLEIASGDVSFSLDNSDDVARQFTPLHPGIIPIIQTVRGDAVTFTIATGLPSAQRSYTWFYRGGVLSETVAAPSLHAAAYPATGDIVNPLPDWRFPAEMELFDNAYQQVNSLHVYDAAQQARFPFFAASDLHFERVWFVQGGEAIVGEAVINVIRRVWVVVGRDGGERRRLPVAGQDVTGTPDGFVYVTPAGEESTALVHVNTRTLENNGDTIWAERGEWRVLWAGITTPTEYRAWAQLAEPIQNPSGAASIQSTPTEMPPMTVFRTIGITVQIYTQDDEYLNLRDAPTTNSNVLALLESGTQAIIIDGPVDAEGYRWWEIRVGTRTGWVVESLPDVLTLIPPQDIPEPTATPED